MSDLFAQNRADRLVEWMASLLFAGLIGCACWIVGGPKLAAVGAMAGFMTGSLVLHRVAPALVDAPDFAVEPFEAVLEPGEELLLDDPLEIPDQMSRVIKLFASGDTTPGALVARIEDYLGRDGAATAARSTAAEPVTSTPDASAALHAALSNIRASLR